MITIALYEFVGWYFAGNWGALLGALGGAVLVGLSNGLAEGKR